MFLDEPRRAEHGIKNYTVLTGVIDNISISPQQQKIVYNTFINAQEKGKGENNTHSISELRIPFTLHKQNIKKPIKFPNQERYFNIKHSSPQYIVFQKKRYLNCYMEQLLTISPNLLKGENILISVPNSEKNVFNFPLERVLHQNKLCNIKSLDVIIQDNPYQSNTHAHLMGDFKDSSQSKQAFKKELEEYIKSKLSSHPKFTQSKLFIEDSDIKRNKIDRSKKAYNNHIDRITNAKSNPFIRL